MEKLDKIIEKYNMGITNTKYNPRNNDERELITWTSGAKKQKTAGLYNDM